MNQIPNLINTYTPQIEQIYETKIKGITYDLVTYWILIKSLNTYQIDLF